MTLTNDCRKLSQLKRKAEQSITWRKHIMAEWIDSYSSSRVTSIMTCAVCGAYVQVNTNPLPNDISIGGSAVALECKSSKKLTHYTYGSGEHGCLYDNGPFAAETLQDAVDALAETFELGRTRKARLFADSYLELNLSRDGASYCEIAPCQCERPWEHNEDSAPEDWPDYPQPPRPIRCDQCEMLAINGIACHETGCPNTNAVWDSGEWRKTRKCFDCGCTVWADDDRCCKSDAE